MGRNTSTLSRALPPATLRGPPGPRNAPEPALPPSRTTTIPIQAPPRLLLHLHLLPRNPSLLRNPRGSSWRLPKTSARERFSRHERGSLRTTDGEDIHGREDLRRFPRVRDPKRPLRTPRTHEFTHSRNARRGWERLRSLTLSSGRDRRSAVIKRLRFGRNDNWYPLGIAAVSTLIGYLTFDES